MFSRIGSMAVSNQENFSIDKNIFLGKFLRNRKGGTLFKNFRYLLKNILNIVVEVTFESSFKN